MERPTRLRGTAPLWNWRLRLVVLSATVVCSNGLHQHHQLSQALAGEGATLRIQRPHRQVLHNADGHGMEYVADIRVGNQVLRGILDTGSYELLVFSKRCVTCGNTAMYYDDSASSSFEGHLLKTMHSFGSGDTMSRLAFDHVDFGPDLGIQRQYFWEVYQAKMEVLTEQSFQVIVGVGPPSTPRRDTKKKALNTAKLLKEVGKNPADMPSRSVVNASMDAVALVDEKTVLENLHVRTFSVCLRRQPDSAEGYFIWDDDVLETQPELFVRIPLDALLTWGVLLTSPALAASAGREASSLGCAAGCKAIVDSGTSLIVAPTEVLNLALAHLNSLEHDCTDMAMLPNLEFELGGHKLSLPPESYIGKVVGRIPPRYAKYMAKHHTTTFTRCEVLIMPMDIQTPKGPMVILGMPFLREFYTTFDIGADMWDMHSRSISVAPAGEDCQPAARTPSMLQRRPPRVVDLSKVRLPAWAEAAAKAGWMDT